MAHVPHIYAAPPWGETRIEPGSDTRHDVQRVMRRSDGALGDVHGRCGLLRQWVAGWGSDPAGERDHKPAGRSLTAAMAAPHRNERLRYAVEKLAELCVAKLRWLDTAYVQGSPSREAKATTWAIAAVQQLGGARLLAIDGPVTWPDLGPRSSLLVAQRGGTPVASLVGDMATATIVAGPEGGFADDEVPQEAQRSMRPICRGVGCDIRPDHPMPIYSFRLHAFDRAYPPLPQVGFL